MSLELFGSDACFGWPSLHALNAKMAHVMLILANWLFLAFVFILSVSLFWVVGSVSGAAPLTQSQYQPQAPDIHRREHIG